MFRNVASLIAMFINYINTYKYEYVQKHVKLRVVIRNLFWVLWKFVYLKIVIIVILCLKES